MGGRRRSDRTIHLKIVLIFAVFFCRISSVALESIPVQEEPVQEEPVQEQPVIEEPPLLDPIPVASTTNAPGGGISIVVSLACRDALASQTGLPMCRDVIGTGSTRCEIRTRDDKDILMGEGSIAGSMNFPVNDGDAPLVCAQLTTGLHYCTEKNEMAEQDSVSEDGCPFEQLLAE